MKIGILITTYNRPGYLSQCLESIKRADIPAGTEIVIVDDCSNDPETNALIAQSGYGLIRKESRSGIKTSLLAGYQAMFNDLYEMDLVINVDGDAIVRNDFISVLINLKKENSLNIISGFNTTVKNRNPVIAEHGNFFEKKFASGICICIDKRQYGMWVKPSLQREGNWDYNTSLLCVEANVPVIVSKPSVVQHIGTEESAMGHISPSNPPDVAFDFKPLHLPQVTLFGIAYNDPDGIRRAAEISQRDIIFGDVVIITEKLFEGRVGYSHFCMKELNQYIKTDFVLKIEPDGYVQNWKAWDPVWLQYDLIGAPWHWYPDNFKVGNGISLRSKKLYDILANDPLIFPINDSIIKENEEDHNICRIYRPYLERYYGIKFAPVSVAEKFSIEAWRSDDDTYGGQFVFHGYKVKELPYPPLPKVKP